MNKKLIIYGFKLSHGNAHKHIHNGFNIAAKSMGYEVYWMDDQDTFEASTFNDSIIITEGWANNNLPVAHNSKYFIHHFGVEEKQQRYSHNTRYLVNNNQVFDLRFLCQKFEDHNQKWDVKFKNLEKIDCCSYLEPLNGYTALYQPWATDLLPEHINFNDMFLPKEPRIYFLGTIDCCKNPSDIWEMKLDNHQRIMRFKQACDENNIEFIIRNTRDGEASDEEFKQTYQNSLLSPDIRNIHKKEVGYIPCRVFKNISYGNLGMTDTIEVYDFFNHLVAYHDDPYYLFFEGMKYKNDFKMIKEAMVLVKENHTYVNRIKAMEQICR